MRVHMCCPPCEHARKMTYFGRRDQTAQVTELGSTLIILPRPRKKSAASFCAVAAWPWDTQADAVATARSSDCSVDRGRRRCCAMSLWSPAAMKSRFEALLETGAMLILAPLMPAIDLDPDATDEARSLTVVIVRVLCGRYRSAFAVLQQSCCCSAPSHGPLDAAD